MAPPRIVAKQLAMVSSAQGTYYWCQCSVQKANRFVTGATKKPR